MHMAACGSRVCTVSVLIESDADPWAKRGVWLDINSCAWMGMVLEWH